MVLNNFRAAIMSTVHTNGEIKIVIERKSGVKKEKKGKF